jgi:hypothetical protein
MALAETEVELRAWLDRLAIQDLIYRHSDALTRADWKQAEGALRSRGGLGNSSVGPSIRRRCRINRDVGRDRAVPLTGGRDSRPPMRPSTVSKAASAPSHLALVTTERLTSGSDSRSRMSSTRAVISTLVSGLLTGSRFTPSSFHRLNFAR